MKNKLTKPAFTLVELLITIVVIGVLISLGLIGYDAYQNHSRTNQNKIHAEEVSQKITSWSTIYKSYPKSLDHSNTINGETYGGSSTTFSKTLTEDTRKRVEAGEAVPPSASAPENINIQFCYRPDDVYTAIGARVSYWDLVNKKVVTIDVANSGEADVLCAKAVESETWQE